MWKTYGFDSCSTLCVETWLKRLSKPDHVAHTAFQILARIRQWRTQADCLKIATLFVWVWSVGRRLIERAVRCVGAWEAFCHGALGEPSCPHPRINLLARHQHHQMWSPQLPGWSRSRSRSWVLESLLYLVSQHTLPQTQDVAHQGQ